MGACSLGTSWAPRSCAGDSRFLVADSVGDRWCWWPLMFWIFSVCAALSFYRVCCRRSLSKDSGVHARSIVPKEDINEMKEQRERPIIIEHENCAIIHTRIKSGRVDRKHR